MYRECSVRLRTAPGRPARASSRARGNHCANANTTTHPGASGASAVPTRGQEVMIPSWRGYETLLLPSKRLPRGRTRFGTFWVFWGAEMDAYACDLQSIGARRVMTHDTSTRRMRDIFPRRPRQKKIVWKKTRKNWEKVGKRSFSTLSTEKDPLANSCPPTERSILSLNDSNNTFPFNEVVLFSAVRAGPGSPEDASFLVHRTAITFENVLLGGGTKGTRKLNIDRGK